MRKNRITREAADVRACSFVSVVAVADRHNCTARSAKSSVTVTSPTHFVASDRTMSSHRVRADSHAFDTRGPTTREVTILHVLRSSIHVESMSRHNGCVVPMQRVVRCRKYA